MSEEWREVPGFPDYEVSSEGRVRRATPGPRTFPGKILACNKDSSGYRFHQVKRRGVRRQFWVHLAVAEAFRGGRPEGMLADHMNRIRDDNRACNLRWVTRSQNVRHGEEVAISRLNPEAVKVIRHMLTKKSRRGMQLLLARLHGVTHEAIRKVKVGESWR